MAVNVGQLQATLELETSKFKAGAAGAESALGSLKRVFEVFAGFQLARVFEEAVRAVKQFTTESIKLGFEAKIVEAAYRNMAQQVGVSSEALIRGLKAASGGIVNESDVMRSAARALQQGLQPEQITRLMEIARAQSALTGKTVTQAFNDMTESIANQQVRALKAMGIVIDLEQAMDDYSRSLGVSKEALTEVGREQAIVAAVFKATEGRLVDVTSETMRQKEAVEEAAASWTQLKEDLGKTLIDTFFPLAEWFRKDAIPVLLDFGGIAVRIFREVIAGFQLMATPLAGGFAFIASIIADLSNLQFPSLKNATANAMDAMEDWATMTARTAGVVAPVMKKTAEEVRLAETSFARMGATGANAWGGITQQVKVVPEQVAKVREAFATLNAQLLEFGTQAEKDEQAVQDLLKPFRELLLARQISEAMFAQAEATARAAGEARKFRDELESGIEAIQREAMTVETSSAASLKIREDFTAQSIALHGTEEEAFEEALRRETGAATDFALKNITDNRKLDAALTRIRQTGADKREEFERKSWDAIARRLAQAVREAQHAAMSEVEKVTAERQRGFHRWDQMRADGLIDERTFQRAVQNLDRETAAKRLAGYATDFNARVQSLATTETAVRAFYASEENLRLAAAAQEIATNQKLLTDELAWRQTANADAQTSAVLHAQLEAEKAQASGNFFGFLGAKFKEAAAASATVWQGMATLVQSTVQGAQSALSSGLFEFFKTGTLDMQKVFQGFLDSMLKAVADLLAQQAVIGLLKLGFGIFNIFGFAQGGVAGIAKAAPGPTDVIPALLTPGETVLTREATALLSKLLSKLLDLPEGTGISEWVLSNPQLQNMISALGGGKTGFVGAGGVPISEAARNAWMGAHGAALEGLTAAQVEVAMQAVAAGATPEVARATAIAAEEAGMSSTAGAALGPWLSAAAVAYNLYSGITALDEHWEAGAGTLIGTAAGGVIGAFVGGPVGALAGAAIGGALGGLIGGLFGGGPSNFEKKRSAALASANESFMGLIGSYQSALGSGDLARVLDALQHGVGDGARGAVRADIAIPPDLASLYDLPGGNWGAWSPGDLERFLLGPWAHDPAAPSWIIGSGDIAYLSQKKAEAVAGAARATAIKMLDALVPHFVLPPALFPPPPGAHYYGQDTQGDIWQLLTGELIHAPGTIGPTGDTRLYDRPWDLSTPELPVGNITEYPSLHRGGYVADTDRGRDVWALMEPGELTIPTPFAEEFPALAEAMTRGVEGRRAGGGATTLVVKVVVDGREVGEAVIRDLDRQVLAGRKFSWGERIVSRNRS